MAEIGAIYRHYKNHQLYEVIAIGKHSETLEDLVIYKALYESDKFPMGQIWCRPLKMWDELVDDKPRFEKIS
ncbi:MAG: DUF1653 domain-containing protein [Alphaproteobacteria bacterium]|nr:DUF1653 domain-containing protein [Alphaproteobacteria bacterium]